MAQQIAVNDVLLRARDYCGNYSYGQANQNQQLRAVDSAVNYLKNLIGLPNDEAKYQFYFAADNAYYNLPSDFQEYLSLYYDEAALNTINRAWQYRPYQEVLPRLGGYPGINTVSSTTINGPHQLLLWGTNVTGSQLVESFDINIWTPTGDASNNHIDSTVFYQGTASNNFTITYATGTATLTSPNISMSFEQLFQDNGNLNLYAYFASTDVISVAIKLLTDTGDYWTITQTTQANSSAWALNQWNKITFPTSAAVQTGAPNANNITKIQIVFMVPSNFGTVLNMRVDDLYVTYPDLLDLIYVSNYKATNAAGTKIVEIGALTDVLNYDWDFIEPIALQTALYLFPQLRADPQWFQIYQSIMNSTLKTWARRWPKRRDQNNFRRTQLLR